MIEKSIINEVLKAYFTCSVSYCESYGNGHINDTFLVICGKKYILQRMNTNIFTRPVELMENVIAVTEHIREKSRASGLDSSRSTLTLIPALSGNKFYVASDGSYWRLYDFVVGSVTRERVEDPEEFYKCAVAFGVFQQQLADFPADKLHTTIENLHNTPWRLKNLIDAAERDPFGRLRSVMSDLDFALSRRDLSNMLENAYKNGDLPLRVTHNDTKLNNILFDAATGDPLCVIDLDTVMPGYSVTDFGDSIRFGANRASEDEKDVSKISLDLDLFELYTKGFIEGCGGKLTKTEIELLPYGALVITLELGMRFLTDHLLGDVYFKIHRPDHNLDRARAQFALLADMERKLGDMVNIVDRMGFNV